MKHQKRASARTVVRRPSSATRHQHQERRAAKRYLRRQRSSFSRVLLQPLTIVIIIVIGLLLLAWTYQAVADDLSVTATVPAPPLTEPAVITSPSDGAIFTASPITVTGTCPANSYVKLSRNGLFSGVAMCVNQTFQITTDLFAGDNILNAQDFNITDQAGPAGQSITVTYEPPPAPTPVSPSASSSSTTPSSGSKSSSASSLPLVLESDFHYETFLVGSAFNWTLQVKGGTAPYTIHINWDDGTASEQSVSRAGSFTITHTYAQSGYYPIIITVTDSASHKATLQLAGLVHAAHAGSVPLPGTTLKLPPGPTGTATNWHWLAVAWPFYLVALLITLSFYLGERQELLYLTQRHTRHLQRHA